MHSKNFLHVGSCSTDSSPAGKQTDIHPTPNVKRNSWFTELLSTQLQTLPRPKLSRVLSASEGGVLVEPRTVVNIAASSLLYAV